MIIEGTWVDFKGWRVWVYEGQKMKQVDRLKEAQEIYKSGYLKSSFNIEELNKK